MPIATRSVNGTVLLAVDLDPLWWASSLLLAPLFQTSADVLHELDEQWGHEFCQQKEAPDSAFEKIVIVEELLPGRFRNIVAETEFKQHDHTDPTQTDKKQLR